MANYPPTPSFGGAFNLSNFSNSLATPARENGSSTYQSKTAAPRGQDMSPIEQANNTHFSLNSQIPGLGQNVPHPQTFFPPDLLKHFANPSYPPPPPPAQLIPLTASASQSFTPPIPTPQTMPQVQPTTASSALPNTNQKAGQNFPHDIVAMHNTREEGELSDGELEETSEPSQDRSAARGRKRSAAQMTAEDLRANASSGPSSRETFGASYARSRFQALNEIEPSAMTNDNPSSSEELSVISYNPPSASTPEQMINTFNSLNSDTTGHQPATFGDERNGTRPHPKYLSPTKSSLENKREHAKDALSSLLPSIGYHELVNEGIHPHLLQQLFQELGVDSLPLAPRQPLRKLTKSTENDKGADSGGVIPSMDGSAISKPKSASVTGRIYNPANTPHNTTVIPEVGQSEMSNSDTRARTSPSLNISAQPNHAIPPSNSMPLSRKDLIAQRLAAKTGRTVPSQSPEIPGHSAVMQAQAMNAQTQAVEDISRPDITPLATSAVLNTSSRNLVTSGSNLNPANTEAQISGQSVVSNNPPPATVVELSPTVTADSNIRAKSKAQTELVRKKMEALKKEALARQQAGKLQDQPPSTMGASVSQASTTPAAVLNEPPKASDSARMHRLGTVPPLHLPSNNSSASQIPGLFLAASDSPQSHADEFLEQLQIPAVPVDPHNPISEASALASRPEIASQQQPNTMPTAAAMRLHSPQLEYVSSPKTTIPAEPSRLLDSAIGSSRLISKRPVALDSFDDGDGQRRRPFGRKESNDHVEIVLSEDGEDNSEEEEEGEIGMDLDDMSEVGDGNDGDNIAASRALAKRTNELSNPPPSVHPLPAKPTTTTITNSIQTPISDYSKEDLFRSKNMEIEAMRRRIAEMEARAKAKKAVSSRAQSPKSSAPSTPIGLRAAATTTPFQESSRERELRSTSSTPLPPMNDPSRAEALRHKLLRRRQIQEGLPTIDAEVVKAQSLLAEKQARLAEMQLEARRREAEMQEEADKLAASIQHSLDNRQTLVDELEQLGVDVDSLPLDDMPTEELEARRNQLLEEQGNEDQSVIHVDSEPIEDEERDYSIGRKGSESSNHSYDEKSDGHLLEVGPSDGVESGAESMDRSSNSPEDEASLQLKQGMAIEAQDSPMGGVPLQETFTREQAEYGPDGDDASVSMSDDESEDYEPMDPIQEDEESDGYEPPETSPDRTEVFQQSQPDTQSIGAELSGEEGDGAMDLDEEPYEPQDITETLDDDDESYEPPQPEHATTLVETKMRSSITPSDIPESNSQFIDLDANHQVSANDEVLIEQHPQTPSTSEPLPEPSAMHFTGPPISSIDEHFAPYESPLSLLKNFRFNEEYEKTIPGGYRSLKYSGRINPSKAICAAETSGERCTDPDCEDQHFRDMELSDDKILVEMSSAKDFHDKDQRDRYVAGLKQVIAELRTKGVKEFSMVASELAAYRRRFVNAELQPQTLPQSGPQGVVVT